MSRIAIRVLAAALVLAAPVAARAADAKIVIDMFKFGPPEVTVKAGQSVEWLNKDQSPHSVVAKDGSFRSPALDTGAKWTHVFAKAGVFAYYCGFHPYMTATVKVTP